MEEKQADSVSILLMNPQNGEIYAMVNVPEFNLNDPYELNTGVDEETLSDEELQDQLNQMWRTGASMILMSPDLHSRSSPLPPAWRRASCRWTTPSCVPVTALWRTGRSAATKWEGMESETFVQGIQNSCNRCLSTSACGLAQRSSMTILKNRTSQPD